MNVTECVADKGGNAQPQSNPGLRYPENVQLSEASMLRERLILIEMELVKTRLNSLEILVSRVATQPITPMPGLQYPYTGIPTAYAFGHQIPQIPTPYQTLPHMTVPMPYMNIPPPFPVPGNIYYPTPQIYNPNSFLPLVDTRHVVQPLQGQRITADAQPPRPRHFHTDGMPDGNNFRPAARVNRH